MQKKRTMILFELLIALSLTAILLTFLFSFFVQSAKIEKKLDTARMFASQRGHLQTRLQMVFTSLDLGGADPYLYTKQFEKDEHLSLIILFDNGIDPDPAFSGTVLGRIYLDGENNLNLTTWALTQEKNRPWRNEILYKKVKDFEFQFLGPNSATEHGKKETIRPITPNLAWRTQWPKTFTSPPGIIRLTLFEEGVEEPLRYAFILPVSEPFITYREKTAI